MSENYFKVFDESQTNMQSQTSYEAESVVADGYSSGIVKSETMNKILHQSTIMAAALAGAMEDAGLDAVDTDLSALKSNLKTVFAGQKVYYSFESVQSGATQDTPLKTILGAMAVNSTLCVAVTTANTYYPAAGYIVIRKFSSASAMGELITTAGVSYELYVANVTANVVAANWKLPTTTVDMLTGTLPITKGGTNATTAKAACASLGAIGNQRYITGQVQTMLDADVADPGIYAFDGEAADYAVNSMITNPFNLLVMNPHYTTQIQWRSNTTADQWYWRIYNQNTDPPAWTDWAKFETSLGLATDVQALLSEGSVSVVKNIQRGDANYSVSNTQVYVLKLGSSVNVAKTMIIWENENPSTSYGSHPPYFTSYTSTGKQTADDVPEIKKGTTQYIAFPRSGSSSTASGNWQLVEFY